MTKANKCSYWALDNSFYKWKKSDLKDNFDLESWLALNANLNLIKFDPKFTEFYESERIQIGDYKLYQMINWSGIRNNSYRFLADIKEDKVILLYDSNEKIYELFKTEHAKYPETPLLSDTLSPDPGTGSLHIWDYTKFFFNNIVGRHGRFEIVENLDEVRNRINNFYKLNPEQNEQDHSHRENWENALIKFFDTYNEKYSTDINISFREDEQGSEVIESYTISEVPLIFKNALFKCTVNISVSEDNYGVIELSNESQAILEPDISGKFELIFNSTKNTPEIDEEVENEDLEAIDSDDEVEIIDTLPDFFSCC
ncbi:MAG: hypothetical protein EOP48_22780 [Sphingobacteriales bacterium]|nr:MAG: hypothetical protein EOP48_22780 [Sphingobacteriales bacterium]